MMDMGRLEVEREVNASQEVKERNRVGTSGKRDQHPSTDQPGEGGQKVFRKSCEGHALS